MMSVATDRHVGLGGEKTDNLEELTVKVCTEQHGGSDLSSRITLKGPRSGSLCLQCQE